ncbi:MAG: glycosyltransferase [Hyphomicrobiales bacterium]
MTRVHIITEGFASPNGRSFLYPIVRNADRLKELGLVISMSTDRSAAIPECDTLMLDSKRFRDGWGHAGQRTLELFGQYRKHAGKLIFVDNSDSAGWINGQALSGADVYTKGLVLRDRETYLKPLHGRRVFTDFYHRTEGVSDPSPEDLPQVANKADLAKIRVHWNSGLADYSLHGPMLMALYHRLPLPGLLRAPGGFISPNAQRDIDVSCRMGLSYARPTVAWQRQRIRELLKDRLRTDKLGRRAYFGELSRSRIVVSPFGLGEITLKDFETFIAGAALLKPDMSHMETWPDFFRAGETMLTHKWDLSDLEETIERALADLDACTGIAEAAQQRYRRHIAGAEGKQDFCERFRGLVR